jgi:hypothetical protein
MHPKKSAARARKEAPTQAAIRKRQNVEPRCLSVKTLISPLLANLFLHYVFDIWMQRNFPRIRFERYAGDAIVHCGSKRQAHQMLEAIRGRFAQCGLELHPVKTRIVYCKDDDRPGEHEHVLPAINTKAAKAIRASIRKWRMASTRNNQRLEDLARLVNPSVR